MGHRGLKLKVSGEGQDVVGLTSILDRRQFSSVVKVSETTAETQVIPF